MTFQIPSIAHFDPTGDPNSTAQRWEKWLKSFQYFIIASNINEDQRKRALLLHLIEQECQKIFETLPFQGDTYQEAETCLNNYFKVQKNVPYERSIFKNAKQNSSESIEQYVTRLRALAMYCEYGDKKNKHIRDQVIVGCRSSKFRTKLLEKKELSLGDVLEIGKTREAALHQTKQMEANEPTTTDINQLRQGHNRGHRSKGRGSFNRGGHRKPYRGNYNNTNRQSIDKPSCGRYGATGHESKECRRTKGLSATFVVKLDIFVKCALKIRTKSTPYKKSPKKPTVIPLMKQNITHLPYVIVLLMMLLFQL